MKLKTSELKRFFSNSNTIKSKGILPILDYLKISDNKIIKTNLNAYVVMDITPTGETMLINEDILSSIVKGTLADTIEVTASGNKGLISDGVNKMKYPIPAEEDYPTFPDNDKVGEVILSKEVLEAVGIAAKNLSTNDVAISFNNVNVAHGYVAGSDHVRLYLKKFEQPLPTILIDTLAANIISQFGEVKYYQNGNYDFYEVGSFLFGFAKQEGKPIDFNRFLDDVQKEEYIEMNCAEIFNFYDIFISSSGSTVATIDFNGDKISFSDVDRDVENERVLNTEGDYKPDISLLPRNLNGILRSLNKEKIRMSKLKTQPGVTFWDESDENLFAILGIVSKA